MSLLSDLEDGVARRNTEQGEINAVSSTLIQYGYFATPEQETRKEDGLTIRLYTWYDTPEGDITLVTGPGIEGEVVQLNPPEAYENPAGRPLSGKSRTGKEGGDYIEYRPRMADGSRPRVRIPMPSELVKACNVCVDGRLELIGKYKPRPKRAKATAKKKADRAASIRGVQDRADKRAAAAKKKAAPKRTPKWGWKGIIGSVSDVQKAHKEAGPLVLEEGSGYFSGGENIYFRSTKGHGAAMIKVAEFSPSDLSKIAKLIEGLGYGNGDLFEEKKPISPTKFDERVLKAMKLKGGTTTDLSRRIGLSTGNISKALRSLEHNKLVRHLEIEGSEDKERTWMWLITDNGLRWLDPVVEPAPKKKAPETPHHEFGDVVIIEGVQYTVKGAHHYPDEGVRQYKLMRVDDKTKATEWMVAPPEGWAKWGSRAELEKEIRKIQKLQEEISNHIYEVDSGESAPWSDEEMKEEFTKVAKLLSSDVFITHSSSSDSDQLWGMHRSQEQDWERAQVGYRTMLAEQAEQELKQQVNQLVDSALRQDGAVDRYDAMRAAKALTQMKYSSDRNETAESARGRKALAQRLVPKSRFQEADEIVAYYGEGELTPEKIASYYAENRADVGGITLLPPPIEEAVKAILLPETSSFDLLPDRVTGLRIESQGGPGDKTGQDLIDWHHNLHVRMADLLGSVESSFFGLAPPLQRKVKALRTLKNEHAAERDRLIAEEPEVIEEVIPEPPDEDVMMAKFANLLAGMTL